MGNYDEYLEKAMDLKDKAEVVAKDLKGKAIDAAGDLADKLGDRSNDRSGSVFDGAKEMVFGKVQDARAGKEIRQGLAELQALPELEGAILYSMELGSMVNYLNSLLLVIDDNRLDEESVLLKIREVMAKVEPAAMPEAAGGQSTVPQAGVQTEEAAPFGADIPAEEAVSQLSAEQQAIEKAKAITYSACVRALDALKSGE